MLDYLREWRARVVEQLAEGSSLVPAADASAMKTTEYVAKAQLLKDLLEVQAKDIADFYGLAELKDAPAKPA